MPASRCAGGRFAREWEVLESVFYRCLAYYLGVAFVEGDVTLGAGARYPYAIHSGIAPLDGRGGYRWLSAPRGQMLAELLARARRGECFSTDLANYGWRVGDGGRELLDVAA